MKEYLIKDPQTGKYWVSNSKEYGFVCEVPDDAECCTNLEGVIIFWNGNKNKGTNGSDWLNSAFTANNYLKEFKSAKVLWQRNAEKSEDNCSEVGAVEKTVDSTLSERQASYGCFEDVAFVTENIIGVLKKCNYDSMPHTHRMAMYMIASKMARLVNGDCNHVDSWHDIQGYAKLVEKIIEP